jgi:hypothetical protein
MAKAITPDQLEQYHLYVRELAEEESTREETIARQIEYVNQSLMTEAEHPDWQSKKESYIPLRWCCEEVRKAFAEAGFDVRYECVLELGMTMIIWGISKS